MMIDTHAHLYLEDFDKDRNTLMQRMQDVGVEKVFLPNIDSSTTEALLRMETAFPARAYPMMGLHPCSVKEDVEKELQQVNKWLNKRDFAAVGEIGLDFYWDTTFKEQQIQAFSTQIDWALQHNLPIVIHARNSIDKCIEIVSAKQKGDLKGIFHCFSGTREQAEKIIELGFLMGIGGIVTFKKSLLPDVLRNIDLDHVVLETDAPYLTPVPHRGKRNESSYIPFIAAKIAEIKEISVERVAEITTSNALRLYRL